ncbi:MAG: DUF4398 domain-containing protein [Deltaproteobacteria bacterium]|nr:DUF4398 domain-containing protein [Deltaproteobacteria bacterium]
MEMRVIASALVIMTAVACGPIAYVNEVTRRASTSVDAARAAQADKYAPYYWTRATQYLHQARVKAAKSDWQGANRFGRLATEAADQAVIDAEIAAKDPSKRPLELKPEVAPAKGDSKPAPAKDEP